MFLLHERAKTTALVKEELRMVRTDVKELQDSNRILSEMSSTPSATPLLPQKIPTELSLSHFQSLYILVYTIYNYTVLNIFDHVVDPG